MDLLPAVYFRYRPHYNSWTGFCILVLAVVPQQRVGLLFLFRLEAMLECDLEISITTDSFSIWSKCHVLT